MLKSGKKHLLLISTIENFSIYFLKIKFICIQMIFSIKFLNFILNTYLHVE
jgi:hypothetical protein